MGIGFPGPLNVETGTIFNPPNLNGWDNVPLRDILEKELRLPVSIENDANAAALGEWWKGAGSGTSCLFCITLGYRRWRRYNSGWKSLAWRIVHSRRNRTHDRYKRRDKMYMRKHRMP